MRDPKPSNHKDPTRSKNYVPVQDQALPMYHPAQRRANKHETQRKPHCLHQSRSSPASYICMYVRYIPNLHEQPTAEADRTINVSEFAATYDSLLRPVKVRCDSVLIKDCDLSQRESISLRFPMPRPTYSIQNKKETRTAQI